MARSCRNIVRHASTLAGVLITTLAFPSTASYQGQSLDQAISHLEAGGLTVFYSSDLVRPDMTVRVEPVASGPVDVLSEILAPHQLEHTGCHLL